MRSVPHPVAVVTATDPASHKESSDPRSSWRGATISSFNTVSLYPTAVVSFNIKRLSSTFTAIKDSGQFAIHLLDVTAAGVEIARRFSRGNANDPFIGNDDFTATADKATTPPTLTRPPVTFGLRCGYLPDKTTEINDHVVVFGVVEEIWAREDPQNAAGGGSQAPNPSLIYVEGGYKQARDIIE